MGQIRLIDNKSVFERFPVQVEEIMQKLKKGKSKEKGRSKNIIDWYLSWGETIQSTSFDDILSGAALEEKAPTPQERIDASFVTLYGKINKWTGYADTPIYSGPRASWKGQDVQIGICPQEVVDLIQFIHDEQKSEQNRIESLSPEQKQEEINDLLKQLRKSTSFSVIRK